MCASSTHIHINIVAKHASTNSLMNDPGPHRRINIEPSYKGKSSEYNHYKNAFCVRHCSNKCKKFFRKGMFLVLSQRVKRLLAAESKDPKRRTTDPKSVFSDRPTGTNWMTNGRIKWNEIKFNRPTKLSVPFGHWLMSYFRHSIRRSSFVIFSHLSSSPDVQQRLGRMNTRLTLLTTEQTNNGPTPGLCWEQKLNKIKNNTVSIIFQHRNCSRQLLKGVVRRFLQWFKNLREKVCSFA